MKRENITVEGYVGTWYVIAETIFNDVKFFLLEHEEYGDETAHLIVSLDLTVICDDVYDDWLGHLEQAFDVDDDDFECTGDCENCYHDCDPSDDVDETGYNPYIGGYDYDC